MQLYWFVNIVIIAGWWCHSLNIILGAVFVTCSIRDRLSHCIWCYLVNFLPLLLRWLYYGVIWYSGMPVIWSAIVVDVVILVLHSADVNSSIVTNYDVRWLLEVLIYSPGGVILVTFMIHSSSDTIGTRYSLNLFYGVHYRLSVAVRAEPVWRCRVHCYCSHSTVVVLIWWRLSTFLLLRWYLFVVCSWDGISSWVPLPLFYDGGGGMVTLGAVISGAIFAILLGGRVILFLSGDTLWPVVIPLLLLLVTLLCYQWLLTCSTIVILFPDADFVGTLFVTVVIPVRDDYSLCDLFDVDTFDPTMEGGIYCGTVDEWALTIPLLIVGMRCHWWEVQVMVFPHCWWYSLSLFSMDYPRLGWLWWRRVILQCHWRCLVCWLPYSGCCLFWYIILGRWYLRSWYIDWICDSYYDAVLEMVPSDVWLRLIVRRPHSWRYLPYLVLAEFIDDVPCSCSFVCWYRCWWPDSVLWVVGAVFYWWGQLFSLIHIDCLSYEPSIPLPLVSWFAWYLPDRCWMPCHSGPTLVVRGIARDADATHDWFCRRCSRLGSPTGLRWLRRPFCCILLLLLWFVWYRLYCLVLIAAVLSRWWFPAFVRAGLVDYLLLRLPCVAVRWLLSYYAFLPDYVLSVTGVIRHIHSPFRYVDCLFVVDTLLLMICSCFVAIRVFTIPLPFVLISCCLFYYIMMLPLPINIPIDLFYLFLPVFCRCWWWPNRCVLSPLLELTGPICACYLLEHSTCWCSDAVMRCRPSVGRLLMHLVDCSLLGGSLFYITNALLLLLLLLPLSLYRPFIPDDIRCWYLLLIFLGDGDYSLLRCYWFPDLFIVEELPLPFVLPVDYSIVVVVVVWLLPQTTLVVIDGWFMTLLLNFSSALSLTTFVFYDGITVLVFSSGDCWNGVLMLECGIRGALGSRCTIFCSSVVVRHYRFVTGRCGDLPLSVLGDVATLFWFHLTDCHLPPWMVLRLICCSTVLFVILPSLPDAFITAHLWFTCRCSVEYLLSGTVYHWRFDSLLFYWFLPLICWCWWTYHHYTRSLLFIRGMRCGYMTHVMGPMFGDIWLLLWYLIVVRYAGIAGNITVAGIITLLRYSFPLFCRSTCVPLRYGAVVISLLCVFVLRVVVDSAMLVCWYGLIHYVELLPGGCSLPFPCSLRLEVLIYHYYGLPTICRFILLHRAIVRLRYYWNSSLTILFHCVGTICYRRFDWLFCWSAIVTISMLIRHSIAVTVVVLCCSSVIRCSWAGWYYDWFCSVTIGTMTLFIRCCYWWYVFIRVITLLCYWLHCCSLTSCLLLVLLQFLIMDTVTFYAFIPSLHVFFIRWIASIISITFFLPGYYSYSLLIVGGLCRLLFCSLRYLLVDYCSTVIRSDHYQVFVKFCIGIPASDCSFWVNFPTISLPRCSISAVNGLDLTDTDGANICSLEGTFSLYRSDLIVEFYLFTVPIYTLPVIDSVTLRWLLRYSFSALPVFIIDTLGDTLLLFGLLICEYDVLLLHYHSVTDTVVDYVEWCDWPSLVSTLPLLSVLIRYTFWCRCWLHSVFVILCADLEVWSTAIGMNDLQLDDLWAICDELPFVHLFGDAFTLLGYALRYFLLLTSVTLFDSAIHWYICWRLILQTDRYYLIMILLILRYGDSFCGILPFPILIVVISAVLSSDLLFDLIFRRCGYYRWCPAHCGDCFITVFILIHLDTFNVEYTLPVTDFIRLYDNSRFWPGRLLIDVFGVFYGGAFWGVLLGPGMLTMFSGNDLFCWCSNRIPVILMLLFICSVTDYCWKVLVIIMNSLWLCYEGEYDEIVDTGLVEMRIVTVVMVLAEGRVVTGEGWWWYSDSTSNRRRWRRVTTWHCACYELLLAWYDGRSDDDLVVEDWWSQWGNDVKLSIVEPNGDLW